MKTELNSAGKERTQRVESSPLQGLDSFRNLMKTTELLRKKKNAHMLVHVLTHTITCDEMTLRTPLKLGSAQGS